MSKIDLVPITGAQQLSAINDNFRKVEDALNDKVLYRDNPSGEPNQVKSDVDMNGKRIYNLPQPQSPSEPVRYQDLGDVTLLTDEARGYAEAAESSAHTASDAVLLASASATSASASKDAAAQSLADTLLSQAASEAAADLAQAYAESIDPAFLLDRPNHTGTQDLASTTTGTLPINRGGTGNVTAATAFDALKQPASETYVGVTQFATSAENAAGVATNKAVDPLGIREALNVTGAAPIYGIRAFVNFNGIGTPAVRASGNVFGVVRNGVGDYTVNFTIPMQDVNYVANITAGFGSSSRNALRATNISDMFVGSVRYNVSNANGSNDDVIYHNVSIIR